jgi:hypothetical protein
MTSINNDNIVLPPPPLTLMPAGVQQTHMQTVGSAGVGDLQKKMKTSTLQSARVEAGDKDDDDDEDEVDMESIYNTNLDGTAAPTMATASIAPPPSPVNSVHGAESPSPSIAESVSALLSPIVIVMPAIPVAPALKKKGRKPRPQARNVIITATSSDYMAHSGVFFRLRNIPLKGFVMTPVVDNNNNDDDDDEQEVVGLLTLTCITYQSLIKNGLKKAGFSDVKIEPFEHNAKYAAARKVFLQAGARRASYFQPERDEEMYRIFVTLENKVVVAKLNKAIAELKSAKAELTTNQQTIAEIKQALEGKEQALAASENAYNEAKVKAKTLDDNMEGLSAEHTKLYQWQLKINGERVEVERMRRELEAEKRAMTGCQQAVVEREDAVALAMFADAD